MPNRSWPIWLYTVMLILGYPVVNAVYFWFLGSSGLLPPDGDTIFIPIMGNLIFSIVTAPLVLVLAWFCLRRYNGNARLLSWRADRPVRSIAATIIFGSLFLVWGFVAVIDLARDLYWFEYLLTAYSMMAAPWFLMMRAAIIEQS